MTPKENVRYLLAKDFFISGNSLEYIAATTSLPIETIQLWKAYGDWDSLKTSLGKDNKVHHDVPPIDLLEDFVGLLHIVIKALKTDYQFGCSIYTASMSYLRQIIDEQQSNSSSANA